MYMEYIYIYIYMLHLYPFINQWTLGLLPYLGYCKYHCNKHRGACIPLNLCFCILWVK